MMYAVSSLNLVSAIDPATGEDKWTYDPKAYELHRPTHGGLNQRGIEYWSDGEKERILLVTSTQQLHSIDARTGETDPAFGENGVVDMRNDIATPEQIHLTGQNSPAIVCADTVMMGMTIQDFSMPLGMPAGHMRGYDVHTGEKKWVFHTVPQEGEPGVETWLEESWRFSGNTNVWSWMSCDDELGIVYLPLGTPTSDYYGGHRPGDNLYAESLVALDARTGEHLWHFQGVHHGIWDYDFPAAPNLIDLGIDGEVVPVIAQVSKQAFTYVFNRRTGEPLWTIEERPVEPSRVPGEILALTQPFPTKPPPFDRQGVTKDDLIDLTPELHEEALALFEKGYGGPLFTPLIEEGADGKQGTLQLPGPAGDANWGGAAVDPETGILYVPSQTRLISMGVVKPGAREVTPRDYLPRLTRFAGPQGLPLVKPPWTRLSAIDLNRGEILWQVGLGDGPSDHPALEGLDLPPLGNWPVASLAPGWPLVTETLVFVLQAIPEPGVTDRRGPAKGVLFAFDKTTGERIAEISIDRAPGGGPMTYIADGRQYLVVPVGQRNQDHELIAYALPGA
jgi:quinoprotein glucose dehydrogenase